MNKLRNTFIETLRETCAAHHQIITALPEIIKNVKNEELRVAFEAHLAETEEHAKYLEQVFEAIMPALENIKHNEIAAYNALVSWAKLAEEEIALAALQKTPAADTPENIVPLGGNRDLEQKVAA